MSQRKVEQTQKKEAIKAILQAVRDEQDAGSLIPLDEELLWEFVCFAARLSEDNYLEHLKTLAIETKDEGISTEEVTEASREVFSNYCVRPSGYIFDAVDEKENQEGLLE